MSTHPLLRPLVTPKPKRVRKPTTNIVVQHHDEFLSYIDPTLAPSSQKAVRRSLWSMRKGLAGKEPTSANLLAWLRARLSTDRIAPATLRLERVYANRFFQWCVDMGYLATNPITPIPCVPVPLVEKPTLSEADLKALLKASEGSPLWPIIQIGWFTGARLVDICNLTWGNVDFPNRVLKFTPVKTKKSGRYVELTMTDSIYDLFASHYYEGVRANGYIFPDAKQLHDRDDGSIQHLFRKAADRAGLPPTVSFHCLRHTRATRMLNGENKVDVLVAADVLCLSSLNTLRRYTKTSLADKAKATSL